MKKLLALLCVLFLLSTCLACAAPVSAPAEAAPAAAPAEDVAAPTEAPTPEPTATPEPTPEPTPCLFAVAGELGEVYTLSGNVVTKEASLVALEGLRDTMNPPDLVMPEAYEDYTLTTVDTGGLYHVFTSSIKLPSTVKTIARNAVMLSSLGEMRLPASLETLSSDIFFMGSATSYVVDSENPFLVSQDGVLYSKDLTELRLCPDFMSSFTMPDNVKKVCTGAFANFPPDKIVLSKALEEIEDYGLQNCGFTDLVLPDTLTTIGTRAFDNCEKLHAVTIPASVTSLGGGLFAGCTALKKITLPEDGAFCLVDNGLYTNNMTELIELLPTFRDTSFAVPETVRTIRAGAFCSLPDLQTVVLPEGLESIDSFAFSNCASLQGIAFPSSLNRLETENLFLYCSALQDITLPDGLDNIGDGMFYQCTSLKAISLPAGITRIGDSAFSGCESLTAVSVPEGVNEIALSAFNGCTSLASVTLPKTLQTLGEAVFYETALMKIVLPDGITKIEPHTFGNCSQLRTVEIPASVKTIDESAFTGCSELTFRCSAGSYAEQFAQTIGASVELIP